MARTTTNAFVAAFEKTICYLIPIFIFLHFAEVLHAETTCVLGCNNGIQISLPGPDHDCETLITPTLMLQSSASCSGPKTISIVDENGNTLPQILNAYDFISIVGANEIGQTLRVTVEDNTTGNSCWGLITIEDKLAPVISNCETQNIYCFQNPAPITEGGDVAIPTAEDCSELSATYSDEFVEGECTENYSAKIIRTWIFADSEENISSCEQEIIIDRVSSTVYTPICPTQVSLECDASNQPNTNPAVTGYPYIDVDGNPATTDDNFILDNNEIGYCELGISHSDEILTTCGSSYKILRTWTVYDWCVPTSPGINPWTCIQVIKIEDTTAPSIQTPENFSASTSSNECTAILNIPAAMVTDACANVSVTTTTSLGTINGNGGLIPYPGLPIGDNIITYTATDECDNTETKTMVITVEDNVAPVAVCDQNTIVSLQADGMSTVFAETFDDGSFDNCGIDKLEVRRMASDCESQSPFGPTVTFTCCDIESGPIAVALRVTDLHGNINICIVQVDVQDKLNPLIICPPNKVLDCFDDYTDLNLTGEATSVDNCGIATLTSRDVEDLSSCNEGTVRRRWTTEDLYGNSNTCMQIITLQNNDRFSRDQIVFPLDYETTDCGAELLPVNLSAPYNYPAISEGACDQVAVTFEDTYLPVTAPACFKILRKWIIVDWCQFDANDLSYGYWEHNQIIRVRNSTAPEFTSECEDITVCSYAAQCGPAQVDLIATATDDCTADTDLNYQYTILADMDNDGIQETTVGPLIGNNATGSYPIGKHKIMWTVEDGCGNISLCEYEFLVEDCKQPTPYCINGLAVELMPNTGQVTIWASDFDAGSFDNCGIEEYRLATLSGGPGQTAPPLGSTDYLTFDCLQLGTNTVDLWVKDTNGNWDYCSTYIIIQDNTNSCNTSATISGDIENVEGDQLDEVTVELSDIPGLPNITGADGSFTFPGLPVGGSYTITPKRDHDVKNGITTIDVYFLQRHILGIQPLATPYQLIAADVNNSGSISALDIVEMRKVILFINDEFTNNNSWRFVDKNFEFPNPQNPFATSFPEVANIDDLSTDEAIGFYGVKVGDVNNSAIANSLLGTETRSAGAVTHIATENIEMKVGERYTVHFSAADFKDILACQYTMAFDQRAIDLVDFQPAVFKEENLGFSLVEHGFITTSWDNIEQQKMTEDAVLYSLTFDAKKNISLKDAININSRYTAATAYNVDTEPIDVALDFGLGTINENVQQVILNQNEPNPFSDRTSIGFSLPSNTEATLSIFDVSGKLIKKITNQYDQGYHTIELKKEELNATGIMYYQLETANETITKKMIMMN